MTEQEVKIVIGGLLHDIGKVIYRTGDGRKHSKSGYEFVKDEIKLQEKDILEAILYHHAASLRTATIEEKSLAYITYIADNIASSVDRRKKETEDYGFEVAMPLQPVFNILNGNTQNMYYHPMLLKENINFPTEKKVPFSEEFYREVKFKISETLKGIEFTEQYINSLLEILEVTLSFVPSSTAKGELADISLYDHVKLTAAVNSCIFQHLQEKNIIDYKEYLYQNAELFYGKEVFLLYSMDISGIQKFIYTIQRKDALKTLRAKSFYLEIMMEHIIDCLLEKIGLSRANLIYSGGGHCYMLLPNTEKVKAYLKKYEKEINSWLLENFDVDLYVATGYVEASANQLKNIPEKSYSELFKKLSNQLGEKKANRYTADEIIRLNHQENNEYDRECKVCKKRDIVDDDGLCRVCSNLKRASKDILYQPFFVVTDEEKEDALPLPGNYYLIAESENKLRQRMKQKGHFVRAYSKNNYYTGLNIATKIWVGNYTKGQTFEELADAAKGIKRLGVLRADVDNLGQAFVAGFSEQYNTLSRTATLSRQLSLFFKYYINSILEKGNFGFGEENTSRNATIVYSGGDDLFIVGSWNEIIELSVDIRDMLQQYTQNTLTLSGGIGIYSVGYPVSQMANEVGELEDDSKKLPGKSAVTIFPDGVFHKEESISISDGTYSWEVFINKVLMEKYIEIKSFFQSSEGRGKSFLYHLLDLIRGQNEKINFARYVYLLARLEPNESESEEQKELYRKFAKQMYKWIQKEEDCRQLKTAINLYAYLIREN